MRYVRPFDLADIKPGGPPLDLIRMEENLGLSMTLRRGSIQRECGPCREAHERLAVVLAGNVALYRDGKAFSAASGDTVFIPAGADGSICGGADECWLEVCSAGAPHADALPGQARVISVDASRFEGAGFAYQSLIDRSGGCQTLRLNILQVQPGAGSPDFHIHAFAQLYVILEGEMTIDIGRTRVQAPRYSVVCLPPGAVHRNFNASGAIERHVSFLVPEPQSGEVFDFAVDIHPHEAKLLTALPTQ